jgi:hypothetical protein
MKVLPLLVAMSIPTLVHGQTPMSCPVHDDSTQHHSDAVNVRGDKAMGFSHEKSTHHFQLLSDGGVIDVSANDRSDKTTLDEIRTHLSHVALMFTAGDFQLPMFIHDRVPPGVPVMKSKGTVISYVFESTSAGGRVRITTSDQDALNAVHQFLAFQIEDHGTGDTNATKPPA